MEVSNETQTETTSDELSSFVVDVAFELQVVFCHSFFICCTCEVSCLSQVSHTLPLNECICMHVTSVDRVGVVGASLI